MITLKDFENAIADSRWSETEYRKENTPEDDKRFMEINSRIAAEKVFELAKQMAIDFSAHTMRSVNTERVTDGQEKSVAEGLFDEWQKTI